MIRPRHPLLWSFVVLLYQAVSRYQQVTQPNFMASNIGFPHQHRHNDNFYPLRHFFRWQFYRISFRVRYITLNSTDDLMTIYLSLTLSLITKNPCPFIIRQQRKSLIVQFLRSPWTESYTARHASYITWTTAAASGLWTMSRQRYRYQPMRRR